MSWPAESGPPSRNTNKLSARHSRVFLSRTNWRVVRPYLGGPLSAGHDIFCMKVTCCFNWVARSRLSAGHDIFLLEGDLGMPAAALAKAGGGHRTELRASKDL